MRPAALYLADLYDPQVMRNDRTRGSGVLKALGFAALAAAIFGCSAGPCARRADRHPGRGERGGPARQGGAGGTAGRAGSQPGAGHGAGQRAAEIERIIRCEAYGEHEIAGTLDPSVDLSEPQQMAAGTGEVVTATGPLLEQDGPEGTRWRSRLPPRSCLRRS